MKMHVTLLLMVIPSTGVRGNFLLSHGERRDKTCTSCAHPATPPPTSHHPDPQFLYLTVETTDVGLVSAGTVGVAAPVMDISQPKEQPPHPLQGGRRISAQYLRELLDTGQVGIPVCFSNVV